MEEQVGTRNKYQSNSLNLKALAKGVIHILFNSKEMISPEFTTTQATNIIIELKNSSPNGQMASN